MMKKQIATNILVFLGTTIAFLLCLEIGFRSYYNAWSFQNFIGVGEAYDLWMGNFYGTQYPWDLDKYLGWIPKPFATLRMPAWGNAQVTILEDGIRSNGSTRNSSFTRHEVHRSAAAWNSPQAHLLIEQLLQESFAEQKDTVDDT